MAITTKIQYMIMSALQMVVSDSDFSKTTLDFISVWITSWAVPSRQEAELPCCTWFTYAFHCCLMECGRPEFDSRFRRESFSRSGHTSDLEIGTPEATLPGARCHSVNTGTGQHGVRILWLGEMESLICNFCLSVAARKLVWADPSLKYTSMSLGR